MQGIRSGVIPFVWAEEGGGVTPEIADQLKGMLLTPLWYITRGITVLAIVMPFILTFLLLLRLTRGPEVKQKVTPIMSPVKAKNQITRVQKMPQSAVSQRTRYGSAIPPPPPMPPGPLSHAPSMLSLTPQEFGHMSAMSLHQLPNGYMTPSGNPIAVMGSNGVLYGLPNGLLGGSLSRASSRTSLAPSHNAMSQTDLTSAQIVSGLDATGTPGPIGKAAAAHMLRQVSEEEGENSSSSSSDEGGRGGNERRRKHEGKVRNSLSIDNDDPRLNLVSDALTQAMNAR